MALTRREFLRCAAGLGGVLLLGGVTRSRQQHAAGLRAAVDWIVARQSRDGAWRSGVYAAFRGGDVLTPVVLWALQSLPASMQPRVALARGMTWLQQLTEAQRELRAELVYPLFTAAYAAQAFSAASDSRRANVWADEVERLRITPALGWPAESAACGAWTDSAHAPRYQDPLPDMRAPNLSATVLGLQALAAAGRDARAAFPFVARCQNFSTSAPGEFDDGGFFFAEGDPIRNKAGVAGTDKSGTTRFRSYGAATSDGLLALRACGLADDHPRIRAAMRWLAQHTHGVAHSGEWPADRAAARESLVYYHAQGLGAVLRSCHSEPEKWSSIRREFLSDLLTRQNADGSWCGGAPDSCEDDPLLATAFALRAIASAVA